MRWYNFAVSIHALLAECDYTAFPVPASELCFNPRTPCGVRPVEAKYCMLRPKFQSTHSLRSATPYLFQLSARHDVSIHALLAECDTAPLIPSGCKSLFQSTHSLRSATLFRRQPRAIGDGFNPRTPCGVRRTTKETLN